MNNSKDIRYIIMKHQLEYSFFIPVEQIIDSIIAEIADREIDSSLLLETIFQHVFNGTYPYNDFLMLDTSTSFFNENIHKEDIRGTHQLLYIVLQNNCIMNAFFHELSASSRTIQITAKNEPNVTRNIIDIIKQKPFKKNARGEVRSQFWENRKQVFKDKLQSPINNNYPINILSAWNIAANQEYNALPINTLAYLAPTANFLFTEDACTKFTLTSINPKNIIDKYNRLWNTYKEHSSKYSSAINKLIFDAEINAVFGFTFFNSISTFIDEIHKMPLSNSKSIKDLEGASFNNIILQAANLPMFFNKELFLKYACFAFLNSPQTDFTYFEESARSVMAWSSSSLAIQQQVLNGLNLMRRFFQVLDSVLLPLLFSLWEVTIYELNQKKILPAINMDTYEEYLFKHCDAINYNYFHISNDIISQWGSRRFTFDNKLNNSHLESYAKAHPYIFETRICNKKNIECIIKPNISPYSLETIEQLMNSYCNIQSLKEKRFPYFFLNESELMNYSPITKLITSLTYKNDSPDDIMSIEKRTFYNNYKRNLYEYLASKK